MMGLDTSETCRGWRNVLRISCASSWFVFTLLLVYRHEGSKKNITPSTSLRDNYWLPRSYEICTAQGIFFLFQRKSRHFFVLSHSDKGNNIWSLKTHINLILQSTPTFLNAIFPFRLHQRNPCECFSAACYMPPPLLSFHSFIFKMYIISILS